MLKPLIVAAGALLTVTLVSNQSASAAPYRSAAYRQGAYSQRTYARTANPRLAYPRTAYRGVGYARVGYARAYRPIARYAAAPVLRQRSVFTRRIAAYPIVARPRFVRPAVIASAPAQIIGSIFGARPVYAPRPVYRMAGPSIRVATPVTRVATPAVGGGSQVGQASYYALSSRTASGGSVGAATCAHRSLPFGTRVLVTNLATARQMVLTVNDRGPFTGGRIIDVSRAAAGVLGMLGSGTAPVRVQVVGHS